MNYDDNAELIFFFLSEKRLHKTYLCKPNKSERNDKNIQISFLDKNLYSSFECVRLLYLVFNKKAPYQDEKYQTFAIFQVSLIEIIIKNSQI